MSDSLKNKTIAFLATDGFEQVELTQPWEAVKEAGGKPVLVSPKGEGSKIQGMHHDQPGDQFTVDHGIDSASADQFDGLVLPGGVANPDSLRTEPSAVEFVKQFFQQHKPVAAVCHGPWLLVEADVVRGRKVTSWPSVKTDLINAGAHWVDEACVCDSGLVTSRKPDDLDAFCSKAVEEFAEGRHARQTA